MAAATAQHAAPTRALTANTAVALVVTDGKLFASFKVQITNTSGSLRQRSRISRR
jgi:hypothetical protein